MTVDGHTLCFKGAHWVMGYGNVWDDPPYFHALLRRILQPWTAWLAG